MLGRMYAGISGLGEQGATMKGSERMHKNRVRDPDTGSYEQIKNS